MPVTHTFLTRHRRTIAQAVLLVYVLNPLMVTAQVIVNGGTLNDGRRTFVDQTQSGVAKVNIATPNGAGVSHNTYQQFDVPKSGVVLNNGANNSNTRIAGWVEGNPNLRPGQEAKLILNEVVGGKPSQLRGYLEVAGSKADVIVANEQGVTCNGCGFINTDRATLTTGKPVFSADGSLQQLRVQQGQVTVGPDGLQAADTRVDILSQYANIQGNIHAANIQAVLGQNDIQYATGQVSKQAATAGTSAAIAGLDVGALGGMYANQISLVATGDGVGVKIDGKLLSAGQISIQSDGTLTHKGQTQGDAGVSLKAQTITQAGQVISDKTVDLQAAQLRNTGTTQGKQLNLVVSEDASNSGHLKALDGGLQLQVGGTLRNESAADILSQSQAQIQAKQWVNAGKVEANALQAASQTDLINQGQIKALAEGLQLNVGGTLQNQINASIVSQSAAQVSAKSLINDGVVQGQSLNIQTSANAANTGSLIAGTDGLQLQIGGALRNDKGAALLSQSTAQIDATTLSNAGNIITSGKTTVNASDVSNSGVLRSESALDITASNTLDNSGTLAANLITLQALATQNTGNIQAQSLNLTGPATAKSATLDNAGVLAAQNIRLTQLAQINNSGKISTLAAGASKGQDLVLQAQQMNNAGGTLLAQRDLSVTAGQLDNRLGTIGNAAGSVSLTIEGNTDNRSGSIVQQGPNGQLQITTGLALNNGSGHIEGQGSALRIAAGDLNNSSGKILLTTATVKATDTTSSASPAQLSLLITAKPQASTPTAGQLRNIDGQISSAGNLSIQAQAVITDPSDPKLSEPSSLSFMDKTKATSGTGSASSASYNWQADIAAQDKVNKAKDALDAAKATASAAATALTVATQAQKTATEQKTTTASTLSTLQADLTQAQTDAKAAQAAADAAPLDSKLAKAAQDAQTLVTQTQTKVNTAKTADQQAATAVTQAKADVQTATAAQTSADAAVVQAQTAYNTASAEVKPVGSGSTSGSTSTSAADVPKPADVQLSTPALGTLAAAGSSIAAAGQLQLRVGAGGIDNRQGKIQAQDIQINTEGNLWANQISALKTLNITAQNIEASSLIQATDATLQAGRVHNTGRIEGSQSLTVQSARIDNTGTLYSKTTQLQSIPAANAAQPSALVLVNSGAILGTNSLSIASGQLLNEGTLSGGAVTVQATEQLENRNVIFSSARMTLQGQDIVNNQARIYSMGDMTLEGAQAGQSAGSLFNYAGRIEAQGDLNIAAVTLTNRAVLPSVNQRGNVEHINEGGNIITRATDTFNADGKKAEILSGKTLNIKAQTVNNDYGTLSAWHQVKIDAQTLNNTAYGAIQTENMVVKAACYNCHQTVRYSGSWGGLIESGGAAELKAVVLNNKTTDTRDGFAGLSDDPRVVIVDERSGTQSPLTKAFVDRFGIVKNANTTSTSNQPGQLPNAQLLSDNLVLTAYGKFDFSRFKLPDGKTGLFETAPAASPYLIRGRTDLVPLEVGTQNTVYTQFLGSDYLLTRLGLIPVGMKRLGDAWYETQLVQEQLYAMSGRKYTVAGTSSDYDLMKGLMDAGLLAGAQLGLAAGQSLSAQQQAALTQDMVWPEWQDVDGQRVLVPKVYLAHHEPSKDPANPPTGVGALIVGRKVDITAQDIRQEGAAIQAQEQLSINASGQVSGSGNYSGGTSVAMVAGSVDLQNASVQSAGWLQLETKQGDLNLTATQISAAGNATIKSAGELNLLAQKHEAHVVRKDGSTKDEVKFETSNIQAGGNLTLESTKDLTAQGSKLSAGQDLKVQSTGGSVDLQVVKNTETATNVPVAQGLAGATGQSKALGGMFSRMLGRNKPSANPQTKRIDIRREEEQGVQLQSGGNTQVQAAQELNSNHLKVQAAQEAKLQSGQAMQLQAGHIMGKDVVVQADGQLKAQNLSVQGQSRVDIQAASAQLESSWLQSEGDLKLKTTQGDLTLQNTDAQVAGNANVQSAGALKLLATEQKTATTTSYATSDVKAGGNLTLQSTQDLTAQGSRLSAGQDLKVQSTQGSVDLQALKTSQDSATTGSVTGSVTSSGFRKLFNPPPSTTTHTETVTGVQLSSGGDTQVQAMGNLKAESLKLSAGGDAALGAAGAVVITSAQAKSKTQTGSDVRQSLQTERSVIDAAGKVTLYGQQAVVLSATTVDAGDKALVQSQGDVELGFNTDSEQHNWTTSRTSSSWGGAKKKTTTTQHETVDKTAEVTQINAGQVQVLGNNVASFGAKLDGQSLVQVEGADKTALYAVNEEHLKKADSRTSSSLFGATYKKSTSSDSQFNSTALGTQLTSEEAIKLGVGTVTDVRGAILTAPKIDIVRSQGADTSKDGELILGTSSNTTQTSHTEKTTTAGVWQAQSGNGSTTETANQTQINGQLNIGAGINTTVQIPEGNLKDQIATLSQQPGMGYLNDLAKDPKVNWQEIKLAHDQWSYSQQGLTPAGAALLSIAVAVASGGSAAGLVQSWGFTGPTAAAMTAGMTALASSASVSFVNNGGNIGKTLKDMGSTANLKNLALAMVTAGVLSELGNSFQIDGKNLNDIKVADGFQANLGKAVINNLANAGVTSALTGTSLEDNIKTGLVSAFISAGAGQAAKAIGQMTIPGVDGQPPTLNAAGQALAHALAGCMAGGATGGKQGCESGAIGAVVGELAGKWYDSDGSKTDAQVLDFVKVVAAAAGAVTGDGSAASVSTAVMTAVNAVQNNLLATRDVKKLMEQLGQCTGSQCDAIKRLYTGLMQTSTGGLEGLCKANPQACAGQLPDYVQALKEMQTPEFKALVGNETANRLIDRQVADLSKVVSALNWGKEHIESNTQIAKAAMLVGATAIGGGAMLAVGRAVVAACGSGVLTPACSGLVTELGIGVGEAISGAPTLGVGAPVATAAAVRLAQVTDASKDASAVAKELQVLLAEARTGSVKVVYNGIEISPNLPPPVAGYGYSPGLVPNAKTDNQAYSHWVGFQTEVKLASDLADNGQAVLKWGGAMGAPGNDVISVNPITAEVTLWDTKYRSNPANIGQSPTFANQGTLSNAVREAREAIDVSNLPPAIKEQALKNLDKLNFTTNTVGAGQVKNSVQVRYCSGKPC